MRPVLASFESLCPECHETVELGAPIRYDEELDRWTHDVCPALIRSERLNARPRCTRCADLIDERTGTCLNCGATV